jgi:hypothetical protein
VKIQNSKVTKNVTSGYVDMSEQCLSFRAPKTLKTFSITEKKAEQ